MQTEPTHNEILVKEYERVQVLRAGKSQAEQTVDGVSVKYMSNAEIRTELEIARRKVRKEKARKSGRSPRRTETPRFRN